MTPEDAKALTRGQRVLFRGNRPGVRPRQAIIEAVGRFGKSARVWFEDSQIPGRWFSESVSTANLEVGKVVLDKED